jgi:phenylpyruvate tautomerase PptA (4-oxalocrotonate tautomerase family)
VPYLRVTCPEISAERRRIVARRLTEAVNDIFWNPRSGLTRDELRERTTVHFLPYGEDTLFIGGRTPAERAVPDITVELSDWSMPVRMQRRIAREFTPVLAQLFNITTADLDNINIRFHSYPPTDFAVGGKLLSDIIPAAGRVLKRWLSR